MRYCAVILLPAVHYLSLLNRAKWPPPVHSSVRCQIHKVGLLHSMNERDARFSGCKIKALRNKTNTYIKTPSRGEDPVFVITGRREDVATARREILSAADHFSQIRASRRAGASSGGGGGGGGTTTGSLMSSVATAGTSSGTASQPLTPSPATGSSSPSGSPTGCTPTVAASSPPSSAADRGQYQSGCASISGSANGHVTCEVRVPVRVVGLVVGPKGATVKRIQAETGTYIVTPSRGTDPVFEIVGSPDNVERARREIESYVVGNGGGSRLNGSTTMTSTSTSTAGSGTMFAGSSMHDPLSPLSEQRGQAAVVTTPDWRQMFHGTTDCRSMMASSSEKLHAAVMPSQLASYGCSDMLNFGARLRIDDVAAPTLGVGSKATCIGGGMDDFGAQLLLLQAAAEAAAAAGLHHHHQRQQTMPSLSPYGSNRDSAVDVLAAAEQLIGTVAASGSRSSAFDTLPLTSYWSQVGNMSVRGRQQIPDCDPFDTWMERSTSTGESSATILQSLHQQSAAAPDSISSTTSSAVFRQYPGLLPEIDSLDAVNPWLCAAAALPSANCASRLMPRGTGATGNRWMESQSPSSSSSSSLASESALPGSPVTTGFSTSTVCLF